MGFSNLISSALTAVATLSGDPDIQRAANSANDLVVSYQTQQQQAIADRILSSPDGIIPVTEKGVTVWRALQYNENGEVVGFSDFNSKEVDQVIISALVATGDDTTRDISSLWFEATAEQDARDLVTMVDSRPILVDIDWGNHT